MLARSIDEKSAAAMTRRVAARPRAQARNRLRLRRALGTAVLGGALLPGPAQAQLAGGYSGSEGIQYVAGERTFSAIRQMGDCFALRRERDSLALLATPPGSPQEGAAMRTLLGRFSACIPTNSRLRAPRDVVRGAVADGMYRRLGLQAPAADTSDRADMAATLVGFARCVARRHPRDVHNLVTTTRLGSRAEQAALMRMFPQLRACLPPADNPRLVGPFVRLALADALYERARPARSLLENAR